MERPTGLYQLLVNGKDAAYIIDDWVARNYDFDMRVRRAKTKGKVVIELTDPLYASKLTEQFNARLNIKKL